MLKFSFLTNEPEWNWPNGRRFDNMTGRGVGRSSETYIASALSQLDFWVSCGKGVRSQKPARPYGCFALLTPDPFSATLR